MVPRDRPRQEAVSRARYTLGTTSRHSRRPEHLVEQSEAAVIRLDLEPAADKRARIIEALGSDPRETATSTRPGSRSIGRRSRSPDSHRPR